MINHLYFGIRKKALLAGSRGPFLRMTYENVDSDTPSFCRNQQNSCLLSTILCINITNKGLTAKRMYVHRPTGQLTGFPKLCELKYFCSKLQGSVLRYVCIGQTSSCGHCKIKRKCGHFKLNFQVDSQI